MEDMKNSSLFAAAFHRFISQPASSRSSALLSLAAFLVLSFFGGLCGYTVYFSDPPHMSDNEIIASISGTGRYVLDRFLTEQHYQIDSFVKIPPVLDLTDKENNNFDGTLEVENDSITVRNLFENKIKIPVIQRDYCMGMQINENNKENFLKYLINNFNNNSNKTLNVSTILVSKEIDSKIVYIFDGQQRTYTIYQILKHLGKELKSFEFIGRGQREHGIRYSEKSVKNLQKHLDEVLKNYDEQKKAEFVDFLWNNVTFTVKQLVEVSSAEQFFMDINGGVPLEPYEIYKSCLYNRLKSIDEEFVMEFMKLVENNWLNSIYNLLDIKEDDESDKEEITEIRLIEYLCRYFYKRKTEKTAVGFDELESKSMVVEKTRAYLNGL